MYAGGVIKIGL